MACFAGDFRESGFATSFPGSLIFPPLRDPGNEVGGFVVIELDINVDDSSSELKSTKKEKI